MSQKKCAVGILEALRTLEKKLKDINKASMKKVGFHSDQSKPSLEKTRTLNAPVQQRTKRSQKVNEKSNETEGVYALKLFDTSVTPSSKYGKKDLRL